MRTICPSFREISFYKCLLFCLTSILLFSLFTTHLGADVFCTECGAANTDDAKFCFKCGRKLIADHRADRKRLGTIVFVEVLCESKDRQHVGIVAKEDLGVGHALNLRLDGTIFYPQDYDGKVFRGIGTYSSERLKKRRWNDPHFRYDSHRFKIFVFALEPGKHIFQFPDEEGNFSVEQTGDSLTTVSTGNYAFTLAPGDLKILRYDFEEKWVDLRWREEHFMRRYQSLNEIFNLNQRNHIEELFGIDILARIVQDHKAGRRGSEIIPELKAKEESQVVFEGAQYAHFAIIQGTIKRNKRYVIEHWRARNEYKESYEIYEGEYTLYVSRGNVAPRSALWRICEKYKDNIPLRVVSGKKTIINFDTKTEKDFIRYE